MVHYLVCGCTSISGEPGVDVSWTQMVHREKGGSEGGRHLLQTANLGDQTQTWLERKMSCHFVSVLTFLGVFPPHTMNSCSVTINQSNTGCISK